MAAYTDAVPRHSDANGDPTTDSGSVGGWSPGICSWCEEVALVTTLVRGKRRDFCASCLDKLAIAAQSAMAMERLHAAWHAAHQP